VIGRCFALARLLAEFRLAPGTISFLGRNLARKVVGRWHRSSLATCEPRSDWLFARQSGAAS